MTDHQFDDPLKELETALAIEPSPAFAAGVRARVAGPRLGAWFRWQEMAAAVIALAVLSGLLWRPAQVGVRPAAETPSAPVAVAAPSAAAVAPAPARIARVAAVMPTSDKTRELEVLVPPDQAIALAQLLVACREGRQTLPPSSGPMFDEDGLLIAPEPIQIPAIPFDPILPQLPGGGLPKEIR
jgi:hypothetical protein